MKNGLHSALDIVVDYHAAWTSGDVDRAMTFLSDDFSCSGPAGTMEKAEYRDYLANFVPKLTGVVDVARFAQGDHAVLIYYPQTDITETTPAAEYFSIRDGVIENILLMFDRLAYAPNPA